MDTPFKVECSEVTSYQHHEQPSISTLAAICFKEKLCWSRLRTALMRIRIEIVRQCRGRNLNSCPWQETGNVFGSFLVRSQKCQKCLRALFLMPVSY